LKKINIISAILTITMLLTSFSEAFATSLRDDPYSLSSTVLASNSMNYETYNSLNIGAEAAILIDYDTGQILYQKNINKKLFPASTTKMMTAILALEHGNLSDYVIIDQEVVDLTYGSHIALEVGEVLTLEQLLNGMLIASANDCALAIAKHIGGSVDAFVKMMNDKAKELGAVDTNFVNPNGLHEDEHVSTAHDLALIGQYAMQFDEFRNIITKVTYEIPPTNIKNEARYLKTTNKLLFSTEKVEINGQPVPIKYQYALGVKTGYTSKAKNCLVSYAEKEGQKLLAVVLKANGNEVYKNTIELLNFGFDNFDNIVIGYKDQFIDNIPIEGGNIPYVAGIIDSNIAFPLSKYNVENIERKIVLNEDLHAPISVGQILGEVHYLINGEYLGKANIVASTDISANTSSGFFSSIINNWYWFIIVFLILQRIYKKYKIRNKRRRKRNAIPEINYISK